MKRDRKTFYICLTGLMAALACVSNYISIATPASRIHIGNAVCVLSGLLLGPLYGFFAAAIGNGLFDIIGGYGMEFIITFINKGAIALVTGLIAYKAASKETLDGRDHARIIVGSVLGALAHGLPSVLLPMGADQPLNAARCSALGLAQVLDPITTTPETIREAVATVLADPCYRQAAERIRDEIAALPALSQSIPLLERLAAEKQPLRRI